jgi:DNA-binding response OmpR family regulator
MAENLLAGAGFDVRIAGTLAEFQHAADRWRPEVVLTDIRMPEVSGHELCRSLKRHHRTAGIPVVLFSGLPEEELARLARSAGADGYLCKRDGLEGLAEMLTDLCESIIW